MENPTNHTALYISACKSLISWLSVVNRGHAPSKMTIQAIELKEQNNEFNKTNMKLVYLTFYKMKMHFSAGQETTDIVNNTKDLQNLLEVNQGKLIMVECNATDEKGYAVFDSIPIVNRGHIDSFTCPCARC